MGEVEKDMLQARFLIYRKRIPDLGTGEGTNGGSASKGYPLLAEGIECEKACCDEPAMTPIPNNLNFLWWNVQDFAHYDPDRVSRDRWPKTTESYQEKLNRVCQVLSAVAAKQKPHLLGFAEITKGALELIRDRLFPDYEIHKTVTLPLEPDFRLGVLYAPQIGFENADFFNPPQVPDTTRSILSVDFIRDNSVTRFYFCHLTANFDEGSSQWRAVSLRSLAGRIYDFLNEESNKADNRNIVILGDMNEEPYGNLEECLNATKSRQRAKSRKHYRDKAIKRTRLYNCSWRMLGENHPHPTPETERDFAGTYYWREKKSWHTFDQVIVSSLLLSRTTIYLDEQSLRIIAGRTEITDEMLESDGLPCKFDWNDGKPVGVSDHLPIIGRLILSEEQK